MRYYISAASSNHGRVKLLAKELNLLGHVCAYDRHGDDEQGKAKKDKTETAFNLVQAIRDTELFLLIAPVVRSSHVELGIALSSRYGKRIIIWSETGREFEQGPNSCPYFFHPSVARINSSFTELIEYLKTI